MAYSHTDTVGDGGTVTFPFTFKGPDNGYFREADIEVELDGVPTVDFTLTGPTQVTFAVAPGDQVKIRIMRKQPDETPYTDFQRGNAFGQSNINRSFLQQLYLLHEFMDGFKVSGYYEKQHLNMGTNYKIINLAPGEDPLDAVNVEQAVAAFEDMDAIIAAAEAAAAASAAAALVSETNAATSADEAAASAASIVGDRDAAAASAAAAAVSEANAAISETAAAGSASDASDSAVIATNKAASAAASEVAANNSASAAATSESNAATSETNAATSADEAAASAASIEGDVIAAAASAAAALVSENNAATSESNAATSESNAASSASAAAGSASAASTSAAAALVSENSAETHKNSAGTFAGNALTSQIAAGISAGAAATSESNAAGSASAAAGSASAAAISETNAQSSEDDALTYATAAYDYRNAAQAAQVECEALVQAGNVFFERRGAVANDHINTDTSAWHPMSFNVLWASIGSGSAAGVFTAPIKGLYHFTSTFKFDTMVGPPDYIMGRFTNNGGEVYVARQMTPLDIPGHIALAVTMLLDVGHTVTVDYFMWGGTSIRIEGLNSHWTGFLVKEVV